MSGGNLIETGIALAAVYLALAGIVSHICEFLSAWLALRGKLLLEAVEQLVGSGNVQELLSHPLLASTYGLAKPDAGAAQTGKPPAYIDGRNFSLALWDMVGAKVLRPPTGPSSQAPLSALAATPQQMFAALSAAASSMPAPLNRQLVTLVTVANGDYNQLLTETEAWFDRQMDRVSGWYKRRVQYVVYALSAVLVLCLGTDTISLSRELYTNSSERAPLIAAATKVVQQQTSAASTQPTPMTTSNPNAGTALAVPNSAGADAAGTAIAQQVDDNLLAQIAPGLTNFEPSEGWGLHILGLLLTFFAISLGAPFWFDLLSMVVNVRLAGAKPDGNGTAASQPSPQQQTS